MSGWTKGPWRVDPKRSLRVVAGADDTIASTGNQASLRDEWEANARLIAAAPALVEALAELNDALDDGLCNSSTPGFDKGRLDRAQSAARAALLAAKGE